MEDDDNDDSAGADSDRDSPKGVRGGRCGGRAMGPSICLLTTKACGQGITLTGTYILILRSSCYVMSDA